MDKGHGIYKKLRIGKVHEEAEGFKTFVFEEGHSIKYQSGQYLTLVLFNNKEEIRRSYSITSSPALNEPLSIGVKRIENGILSRQLVDHAKPGDEVLTTGSGGFFILPDNIDRYHQLFFFAGGSGITPIFSLIKTALHSSPHLSIVLVFSNASPRKAAFLEALKSLQQSFPSRFQLELLFSNSPDLSRARLHREMIIKFLRFHVVDPSASLFYISGPEGYMRLCTYTLQEKGIDPSTIKKENFFIHGIRKPDASPPDRSDRLVRIKLGNETYQVNVQYPDSILKAAKKQGIVLPYSCEAGSCGNCVARCVKGTVWHSHNEVLTEKELAKGLVLTCVGHPFGENVELEL